MNPTEFTINDGWQKFTLAGPAVLQVRQGKVFLAYNEQPAYDRDAYTVSTIFPIRGVTEIFVKTAANNRESSTIVLGDVEESDSGSSLTPVHVQQKFEMVAGGMPGQVPSSVSFDKGLVVRYSTVLDRVPASVNDITIRIDQPLLLFSNSVYTYVSYTYTIDDLTTFLGKTTLTYTIYFSSKLSHTISPSTDRSEISIFKGAAQNVSATISYYV